MPSFWAIYIKLKADEAGEFPFKESVVIFFICSFTHKAFASYWSHEKVCVSFRGSYF